MSFTLFVTGLVTLIYIGTLWLVRRARLPLTLLGTVVLLVSTVCFGAVVVAAVGSELGTGAYPRAVAICIALCGVVVAVCFEVFANRPKPLFRGASELYSDDEWVRYRARKRHLRNRVVKK